VITCAEAVQRLWEYAEGALPQHDERQIDEHIAVCRQCCGEAEFAGELQVFFSVHGDGELPTTVRTRLETFLDELPSAAEAGGA
jgi:hypothetical protein